MSNAGVNDHQYNTKPTVEQDQLMADPTEEEREMEEVDRALEHDQVEETRRRAWASAQYFDNSSGRPVSFRLISSQCY